MDTTRTNQVAGALYSVALRLTDKQREPRATQDATIVAQRWMSVLRPDAPELARELAAELAPFNSIVAEARGRSYAPATVSALQVAGALFQPWAEEYARELAAKKQDAPPQRARVRGAPRQPDVIDLPAVEAKVEELERKGLATEAWSVLKLVAFAGAAWWVGKHVR